MSKVNSVFSIKRLHLVYFYAIIVLIKYNSLIGNIMFSLISFLKNKYLKRKAIKKALRSKEIKEHNERALVLREEDRVLKEKYWQAIVDKDYTVNEFHHHYHFVIDGKPSCYGIVSLVDIFGIDIFRKAEMQAERQAIELEEANYNDAIQLVNA